jgi:hypothetical protein
VLSLAGDLHHYSHYVQTDGNRHKFTAGGGGAFLRGTHDLPQELALDEDDATALYRRVIAYPDNLTSQRLRWGNLLFFAHNPRFSFFLGCMYLFCAWIWQSASKGPNSGDSLMEHLSLVPAGWVPFVKDVLPAICEALAHRPGTLLVTLSVPVALWLFADPPPRRFAALKRALWGFGHGIAHLFLGAALLWLFAHINLALLGDAGPQWIDSWRQVLLFIAEMLTSGFVLGGCLMGLYLALSNAVSGLHADEVFSSLHNQDYKNFLRMHLGPQGLTVYPVAVQRVCRNWRLHPAATLISKTGSFRQIWKFKIDEHAQAPWFGPRSGAIPYRLIEGPIHISATKGQRNVEL